MDTPSTLRGLVLRIFLLAGLAMALLPAKPAVAQSSPSTDFLQDEAQTIYLVNLERAAQGAPPLRWNRELTLAARGFSYDSVIGPMATAAMKIRWAVARASASRLMAM
jgi:hypothetical protein